MLPEMKKKFLFIFAGVLSFATACQKEADIQHSHLRLSTVVEPMDLTTKTTYDSIEGKFEWTEGDKIALHYTTGFYYETSIDAANGKIDAEKGRTRDYYAVYPASVADPDNYGKPTLKIMLPDTYDIKDIVAGSKTSNFSPCPMVASNAKDLAMLKFYHVGGLLRVTLGNIPAQTQRIRVTFPKDVTGSYTVSDPGTTNPTISTAGSASNNTITFILAQNEVGTLLNPVVLNIPVPCGTYDKVMFEALSSSGTLLISKTYDRPLTFNRHHGKRWEVIFEIAAFSVSYEKRVVFAPGNVVVDDTLNEDGTHTVNWRFADNQWDSYANLPPTTPGQSSTYSLFGWGTGNNPWLISDSKSDYSTFTDWGVHFDEAGNGSSSINGTTWRTPTSDELSHLFNGRHNCRSLSSTAILVDNDGVVAIGFILLPDDWCSPIGVSFTSFDEAIGNSAVSFRDINIYALGGSNSSDNDGDWSVMEASGAVFLPCSGSREIRTVTRRDPITGERVRVSEASINASKSFYWSFFELDLGQKLFGLHMRASSNRPGYIDIVAMMSDPDLNYGYNVRLVREID